MAVVVRTREHVGEWLVALRADSRDEIFTEVARVIAGEAGIPEGVRGEWEPVTMRARDLATLLADWANELIGRGEVQGIAYDEVRDVAIAGNGELSFTADVRGRPVTQWRSALKAATYHGARLEPEGGQWVAELLFDV